MASRNRTRPLDEKMRNNIGDHLFRYQELLEIQSSTRAFVFKFVLIVVWLSSERDNAFVKAPR